jgi:hypothetical protein
MQKLENVSYCCSGIVKFASGKCNGFRIFKKFILLHYDINSPSVALEVHFSFILYRTYESGLISLASSVIFLVTSDISG